ncbi:hypothetical protein DHEL01_v203543 [Diaporthe helianthi]|uniref:Uncharacterized protein n=1 Tax=Diaporthe helianthi TaxID=158607 RepID=A0A2P5I6H1_DIAHE|nr:hypothetical protein DHEL01_v203543 [Diaporthe helianthi]
MMIDADFDAVVVGQGGNTQAPPAELLAPVDRDGPGDVSAPMAGEGTGDASAPVSGNGTGDVSAPAENLPQTDESKPTTSNAGDKEKAQPSTTVPAENIDPADRLARWLEKMDVKGKKMGENDKYNRTVIISPLPDGITIADVMPRVRGGIDSGYMGKFEGNGVAIVTFKLPPDAITYVEFCAETPIWGLWTFRMSHPGVPFAWERRAKVELFRSAPRMGTNWARGDIPTMPRTIVAAGSRCLVYRGCKPHEVAGIYRAIGLNFSQHNRDQVEAMWLDGPIRDQLDGTFYGNLHVWFTSIRGAQDAKARCGALEFEYDPCSDSPTTLMLSLEETKASEICIFKHHEPFVNIVDINQKNIITGIIQGHIDPTKIYWPRHDPAARQGLDEEANMSNRLYWSLQSYGAGNVSYESGIPTYVPPPHPADAINRREASAGQHDDPFLVTRLFSAGNAPWPRDDDSNSPFETPAEANAALNEVRRLLGFPPVAIGDDPMSNLIPINGTNATDATDAADATNATDTNINLHSNSGGNNDNNDPQSGRQLHPGPDDS